MRSIDADILQETFREECACECAVCRYGIYDNADFKGCKLIEDAPMIKPKAIVIEPKIIEKLADSVVDVIRKIDWDKAIEAYKERPQGEWIKVKDQLPKVPEGKQLVDVLVVAKVHFTPDHVDQRDWTYVVEKATYDPKYGFYGNNIRNYNVKEWMYAPEMPKRYARYVWREEE